MKKYLALASLLATPLALATLAMPYFVALLIISMTNPTGTSLFPVAAILGMAILGTFFPPGVLA